MLPSCAGICETPHVGWEALCDDVKRIIMSKLSLGDLSRAATLGREFREAFRARVLRDRDNLILAAEEGFGKGLFFSLVIAFARLVRGLCPCPCLLCEGGSGWVSREKAFSVISAKGFEHWTMRMRARAALWMNGRAGAPYCIIDDNVSPSIFWLAMLHHSFIENCSRWAVPLRSSLKLSQRGLRVDVPRLDEAKAVVGLFINVLTEVGEDLHGFCESAHKIQIVIEGRSGGCARVREAADLVLPLRHVARAIPLTITCEYNS